MILLPALLLIGVDRLGTSPGDGAPPLDLRSGLWWFGYLGGVVLIVSLVGPGASGPGAVAGIGVQLLAWAAWGLLVFPWAVDSRLPRISPQAGLDLSEVDQAAK